MEGLKRFLESPRKQKYRKPSVGVLLMAACLVVVSSQETLRAQVLEEVNAAIAEAERREDAPRATLFDDVYATLPWNLREQREELLASPPSPRPDAKQIAGK